MKMFRFILLLVLSLQPCFGILEKTSITDRYKNGVIFHREYYHDGILSLTLLHLGVDGFLDAIGDMNNQDYIDAMQAVIHYAHLNGTNVPFLFEEIQATLRKRIEKAESTRKQKIDPWYLMLGVGAAVVACVSYAYMYAYFKESRSLGIALGNAQEQLKNGIPVEEYRTLYNEQAQAQKNSDILAFCFGGSGLLGVFGCFRAIWHPWYERYLERYKELLIITEQITKTISIETTGNAL